jgi:hypothetical protein
MSSTRKVSLTEGYLEDIADAIRTKLNVETEYTPAQMAAAILSIVTPNLSYNTFTGNGYFVPTAPHNGFAAVLINVANSYTQDDEGKVVSNGALVAQTAHAEITENGEYDTTGNNSVTVNVSGGGGGGFPYDNPIGVFELANLGLTWEGIAGEATT